MERFGIKNITKKLRRCCIEIINENVPIVEKNIQVEEEQKEVFAVIAAKQNIGKSQELTILKDNVLYVPIHLQSINTVNDKPVQVNAGENYLLGISKIDILQETSDVFCLIAEQTHTFALKNGVLVSNCADALRYLAARKLTNMRRRKVAI
jgi:hypothetical protein